MARLFRAKFHGRCSRCSKTVLRGSIVRVDVESAGQVMHTGCGDIPEDVRISEAEYRERVRAVIACSSCRATRGERCRRLGKVTDDLCRARWAGYHHRRNVQQSREANVPLKPSKSRSRRREEVKLTGLAVAPGSLPPVRAAGSPC